MSWIDWKFIEFADLTEEFASISQFEDTMKNAVLERNVILQSPR